MLNYLLVNDEILSLLRREEIVQDNNENSYSRLWKVYAGYSKKPLAFKEYIIPNDSLPRANISTLQAIGEKDDLTFFPELVLPESLIMYDGQYIGYTMEYIERQTLSAFLKAASPRQAAQLFDSLFILLQKLHKLPFAFFASDLHEDNIIVSSSSMSLRLIDIDSFFIQAQTNYASRYPAIMRNILCQFPDKYPQDDAYNFMSSKDLDILCLLNIMINYIAQTEFYICSLHWYEVDGYLSYLDKFSSLNGFIQKFYLIASNEANQYCNICANEFENFFEQMSYSSFQKSAKRFKNELDAKKFLSQTQMGSF